jgi:hypothetical protein
MRNHLLREQGLFLWKKKKEARIKEPQQSFEVKKRGKLFLSIFGFKVK